MPGEDCDKQNRKLVLFIGVENAECTDNGLIFVEELIGRAGQL